MPTYAQALPEDLTAATTRILTNPSNHRKRAILPLHSHAICDKRAISGAVRDPERHLGAGQAWNDTEIVLLRGLEPWPKSKNISQWTWELKAAE